MRKSLILLSALFSIIIAIPAFAAPLRVFVADMSAVGAPNRDEMKITLQSLLSSRLTSDTITAVGSAAEADVVVTGTYVTIGKIFSVDAMAKSAGGKTLTRAFVQGEGQDDLIPAIGKLADKLAAELLKVYTASPSVAGSAPAITVPSVVAMPAVGVPAAKSDIIRNDQLRSAPAGDIIKPREADLATAPGNWVSKRLNGAANLMAVGKTLPDGSREIFMAEERRIVYYRLSGEMSQVSETELSEGNKILSLDTIEGAGDTIDIYVTVMKAEELVSQVWQVKGDKLVRVADNLSWFFRSFNLGGGAKKLYVQAMGRSAEYYGDVYEASRNGSTINLKQQIKMPKFGNIYTFNQFKTGEGKLYTTAINPDGYLIVFDQDLKELWRSNDKFGGSELYFQKEDLDNSRTTGDKNRWFFMNMRIQVTAKGDILVGKNDGFWVLGNARSYKRGAVYCMTWNGSSLEEKWRTKDTQNYMPDYYFDDSRNELLMLQTVQRPGMFTSGASTLSIKKVE